MKAPNILMPLLGLSLGSILLNVLLVVLGVLAAGIAVLGLVYGRLWLQAYMSSAHVSLKSLIGMGFRQVRASTIVNAKVMIAQAGLDISNMQGVSTNALEAQVLAGGDVEKVVRAVIIANRAGVALDFDRAAAIDLAGRDVLEAVTTTVSPRVIDCPDMGRSKLRALSAVAKDGVELLIHARVTVRTNIDMFIGGASEETVIARVGQGIISAVGSSDTHMEVLGKPEAISKSLVKRGLDSNTAYEIVSIDIARIDIGKNIGARLQTDQAAADMRTAQAMAECRRAEAVASKQEMRVLVTQQRAELLAAQALVPRAMGEAIRMGNINEILATPESKARILPWPERRNGA